MLALRVPWKSFISPTQSGIEDSVIVWILRECRASLGKFPLNSFTIPSIGECSIDDVSDNTYEVSDYLVTFFLEPKRSPVVFTQASRDRRMERSR